MQLAVSFADQPERRDVRCNGHGVVGVIDHKTRIGTVDLFHMFFLDVINIDLGGCTAFGIPGGEHRCFLKGAVRQFFISALYDHMGTRLPFGMEPPVVSCRDLKGEFFILDIVLAMELLLFPCSVNKRSSI